MVETIQRESNEMKIIHCSDLHIGVETYGSIDPKTGLNTRLLDVLRSVDTVFNFAIKNNADIIIISGDIYKNREPSPTWQREFARRVKQFSAAGIPLVIVPGNHDLPGNETKANSVEIFDALDVEHILIATKPEVIRIDTKDGPLYVACCPWPRRSSHVDIPVALDDLSKLGYGETPFILAAHLAVSGSVAGTEATMSIGTDPVVALSDVANPVYDYVALGHIHRRQVLCEQPPVIYSGSLERLDFGDEGDDKGFYEVDIVPGPAPRKVTWQFHPIEAREFITFEFEINDGDNPTDRILQGIGDTGDAIKDAIVRLKVSIPESMKGQLRESEIRRALAPAAAVKLAVEVRRTARPRAAGWSSGKAMTPLDALGRYMEINQVPADRQQRLKEYAGKIMEATP